ncbi:MAG: LacI family DNA-binding transcriptional regulator [Alicyclobacillus sp.]|nr:LacI family DNA-binding transcriptional regulator [Alicyclobacillus sp.]
MPQESKRRVTLKQVAEHAGVSRATASLILRGSPLVSEQTREKVLRAMQELGYVYNRVAARAVQVPVRFVPMGTWPSPVVVSASAQPLPVQY